MDLDNVKIVKDSHGKEYRNVDGVCFHMDTPLAVYRALLNCLRAYRGRLSWKHPYRLRLYYGDTETGRDWEEVYDVTGYVGNSTGRIKIPILLNNARSIGGGGILDHCIVKIAHANKKHGGVIYFHPKYHIAQGDGNESQ